MTKLGLACLVVGAFGCTGKPEPVASPEPAPEVARGEDCLAPSIWTVRISFEGKARGQTDSCGAPGAPVELEPLSLRLRAGSVEVGRTGPGEPARLVATIAMPCTIQLKGSLPDRMTIDQDWISESELEATLTLAEDGHLTGVLTRLDYVLVEDGAGEGETEHCTAQDATITGARGPR